jgi:hypothetical protein
VGRAKYGLYIEEQREVFAEESELSSQFIVSSSLFLFYRSYFWGVLD